MRDSRIEQGHKKVRNGLDALVRMRELLNRQLDHLRWAENISVDPPLGVQKSRAALRITFDENQLPPPGPPAGFTEETITINVNGQPSERIFLTKTP